MSKTFCRDGQLHYCSLMTALVSDHAIGQGILAPKNILPVMGFFFEIARNQKLLDWLLDDKGRLKERRWLQVLNFLCEEQIFKIGKKSRIADFLWRCSRWQSFSNCRNLQTAMTRPIRPKSKALIKEIFNNLNL